MNADQSNWGPLYHVFESNINLPFAASEICCVRHLQNGISLLLQIDVTLERIVGAFLSLIVPRGAM